MTCRLRRHTFRNGIESSGDLAIESLICCDDEVSTTCDSEWARQVALKPDRIRTLRYGSTVINKSVDANYQIVIEAHPLSQVVLTSMTR